MAKYNAPAPAADPDHDGDQHDQYQTESDAATLMQHHEITSDPQRHQRAHDHLQQKMQAHKDAYKNSRKELQKKTKGRLKNVFGQKGGADFQQEKAKETAQAEQTVHEKE